MEIYESYHPIAKAERDDKNKTAPAAKHGIYEKKNERE